MNQLTAVLLIALSLVGCAASLDKEAAAIQVATANQKEHCRSLGVFGVEHKLGPNKPDSAMNKARNEVAKRGGNAIYIVSTNLDWAEGASVTAEALSCPPE